ncbi:hypothetical protein SCLCIDRAFT_1220345 [Scleroderma citrinum Foug A]|uniref:Uncharacterized protein n=1 Tax=Scleroderma citrinum Foug A TaxID=1036808 RepID=A0A0C2Z3P3_9AGAM|nr:hypothetical protein SCLCIDRAFT_1220345 [Scleroderma citrinum Foug A]
MSLSKSYRAGTGQPSKLSPGVTVSSLWPSMMVIEEVKVVAVGIVVVSVGSRHR